MPRCTCFDRCKNCDPIPYYERTLDSWSPEVVAKAWWVEKDKYGRGGYWYAVLNTEKRDISMPDFLSYGDTALEAQREVYIKISKVYNTEAYGCAFKPGHYTWSFKLCKWWDKVERKLKIEQMRKEVWI